MTYTWIARSGVRVVSCVPRDVERPNVCAVLRYYARYVLHYS